MNKVEAAKLRLLTLAPYVKPSQNRKDINELVNGGIHQHDCPKYTRVSGNGRARRTTDAQAGCYDKGNLARVVEWQTRTA